MELKDLVGLHVIDAVDFDNEDWQNYDDETESCEVCRFRLDGKVYAAIQDPNDGYRSSMREIQIRPRARMKNKFPRTKCLAVYRESSSYSGTADILQLYAVKNGKLILEVGTDNTDDYYPSFVAYFSPENLPANSGK